MIVIVLNLTYLRLLNYKKASLTLHMNPPPTHTHTHYEMCIFWKYNRCAMERDRSWLFLDFEKTHLIYCQLSRNIFPCNHHNMVSGNNGIKYVSASIDRQTEMFIRPYIHIYLKIDKIVQWLLIIRKTFHVYFWKY